MHWRKILGLALICGIAWAGYRVWVGLGDFDLSEHQVTDHRFPTKDVMLAGSLVLPKGTDNAPVLVIVHGDGPQTRWSDDGYLPLVSALLDHGIGVFSWDKPGVGVSGGNWLSQSMSDRADEAAAAVEFLQDSLGIPAARLGYLGFSQAGWVVPQASVQADVSFAILVGPAVSWREQGAYYTTRRLQQDGMPPALTELIAQQELRDNDAVFLNDGPSGACLADKSACTRDDFVRLNYGATAIDQLQDIDVPVLAVWGAEDLNVDPNKNADIYERHLNAQSQTVVIPDATHGLLRAGWYNYQLPNQWPEWKKLTFVVSGRRAFHPDYVDLMVDWIDQTVD